MLLLMEGLTMTQTQKKHSKAALTLKPVAIITLVFKLSVTKYITQAKLAELPSVAVDLLYFCLNTDPKI
jgi:hypothetical protein